MRLFWIEFSKPVGAYKGGCGVTAYDESDARRILEASDWFVRNGGSIQSVRTIGFEDIEENHVRPNMGNIFVRGIWFPKGV